MLLNDIIAPRASGRAFGASGRGRNALRHRGVRSLRGHATRRVLGHLGRLASGDGGHPGDGTRGPAVASGVRGNLRVRARRSRSNWGAVRRALGDVASPVSWDLRGLAGRDRARGGDIVGGVARLMVRSLGGGASGGRRDTGGRTTMLITGGVRVALHRLAGRDRRDASRTTGSIARRMRALGSRARGSGMSIGRGTTGGVAHRMRRDLRDGASRKGRDTGGRTRMIVTGGVRVALLDRLARGDRRDDSGLTGSVALRMGRGLATRASRGRRNVGRRTTRLVTGGVRVALWRGGRRRRAYRDPSRTMSRGIPSPMGRDLRRKASRRGRNVGRRAGWNLTSLMRRELGRRTNGGHV